MCLLLSRLDCESCVLGYEGSRRESEKKERGPNYSINLFCGAEMTVTLCCLLTRKKEEAKEHRCTGVGKGRNALPTEGESTGIGEGEELKVK